MSRNVFLFVLVFYIFEYVGGTTEKMLILSDIHYDELYDSSLSASCSCNAQYDSDNTCSNDSWEDLNGQFGCDSPWTLVESAIKNAALLVPDPNFILFLGDYVRHDSMSTQSTYDDITKVTEAIDYYFNDILESSSSKEIRLIETTFGNADLFPEYHIETDKTTADEYLKHLSNIWGKTGNQLTSQMNATVLSGGYFYTEVIEGLYIISLNTVIYSPRKFPNDDDGSSYNEEDGDTVDPFGQFAWLEATLSYINKIGGKVWIIGHIPPCINSFSYTSLWKAKFISQYTSILSSYHEIIKAQFFGHTHTDEYRVLTISSSSSSSSSSDSVEWMSSASSPLFMVGAISPVFYSNPSFREVWYDSETFEVVDWIVYSALISETKYNSDAELYWSKLYQFSKVYGLTSLSNSEFKKMTLKMLYDEDLFGSYLTNFHANCFDNHVGSIGDCFTVKDCDDTCKKYQLCSLLHGQTLDQFNRCLSCDAFHFSDFSDDDDFNSNDLIYDDDILFLNTLTSRSSGVVDDDGIDSTLAQYISYLSDPSGCSNAGYLGSDTINEGGVVDDDYDEWWDEWWWGSKHDKTTKTSRIGVKSLLAFIIVFIFCLSAYLGIKSYSNREARIRQLADLYNAEKKMSWDVRSDHMKRHGDRRISYWAMDRNPISETSPSPRYSETSSLLSASIPKTGSLRPLDDEGSDSENEMLI